MTANAAKSGILIRFFRVFCASFALDFVPEAA